MDGVPPALGTGWCPQPEPTCRHGGSPLLHIWLTADSLSGTPQRAGTGPDRRGDPRLATGRPDSHSPAAALSFSCCFSTSAFSTASGFPDSEIDMNEAVLPPARTIVKTVGLPSPRSRFRRPSS